jgi:hypothetical protein
MTPRRDPYANRDPSASIYSGRTLLGYLIDEGRECIALTADRELVGRFRDRQAARWQFCFYRDRTGQGGPPDSAGARPSVPKTKSPPSRHGGAVTRVFSKWILPLTHGGRNASRHQYPQISQQSWPPRERSQRLASLRRHHRRHYQHHHRRRRPVVTPSRIAVCH